MDNVVIVDNHDRELGTMDKMKAHVGQGVLHRAVSVLLLRKKAGQIEFLLQKRSPVKPLWPGCWTNTICTHPRVGESYEVCAYRRLHEELGIVIPEKTLQHIFTFQYQVNYLPELSENEMDAVFLGIWDKTPVHINYDEVVEVSWVSQTSVIRDILENPQSYTGWFRLLLEEKHFLDAVEQLGNTL